MPDFFSWDASIICCYDYCKVKRRVDEDHRIACPEKKIAIGFRDKNVSPFNQNRSFDQDHTDAITGTYINIELFEVSILSKEV